jgi:hypothetical protein
MEPGMSKPSDVPSWMIQLTNASGGRPVYIAIDAINALASNPVDNTTIVQMLPRPIEVTEPIEYVLAALVAQETPKPMPAADEGLPALSAPDPADPVTDPDAPAPGSGASDTSTDPNAEPHAHRRGRHHRE